MKITLYHGTSGKRGNQIIQDGCIKARDVERVYDSSHSLPTTDGNVYLATDISKALYYGNKTAILEDDDQRVKIFKVEITVQDLVPDVDELKYTHNSFKGKNEQVPIDENFTAEKSIELTKAVCYPFDICNENHTILYSDVASNHHCNQTEEKETTMNIIGLRDNYETKSSKIKVDYDASLIWSVV